jgi:hypothetical protein
MHEPLRLAPTRRMGLAPRVSQRDRRLSSRIGIGIGDYDIAMKPNAVMRRRAGRCSPSAVRLTLTADRNPFVTMVTPRSSRVARSSPCLPLAGGEGATTAAGEASAGRGTRQSSRLEAAGARGGLPPSNPGRGSGRLRRCILCGKGDPKRAAPPRHRATAPPRAFIRGTPRSQLAGRLRTRARRARGGLRLNVRLTCPTHLTKRSFPPREGGGIGRRTSLRC